MKTIQNYIEAKQSEFAQHPFFKILEQFDNIEEIGYFVPELTFWAMTFQDILRINEERVQDPYLKKVARHHRLEDAGHEKWFLSDKKYISQFGTNGPQDDIASLYCKDSQLIRDAAYAIMAEMYKADEEILNVVLLLTLESSGHIFFEKVVDQVKKTGENDNLKYFSSTHLDVELAHALFEEEMERNLFDRKLSTSTRRAGLKMVDRCYESFNRMLDGLVLACNKRTEGNKEGTYNAIPQVEQRSNQAA